MITIIYDEKEKDMILQASGHAEYAPKGQDIVCAAVSALMITRGQSPALALLCAMAAGARPKAPTSATAWPILRSEERISCPLWNS